MKELLNEDFYTTLFDKTINWAIETVPGLLLIIIIFLLALWVMKIILRRLRKVIIASVQNDQENLMEKEKRATTLINIARGTVIISLWAIFILIFLKKLGMDIAPILAGAGIVGLAVGFGAQELVRDGISGFFLLLENRIRTGDVVVINGTGGLVEGINLRTVTLRDLSGVVHTFQNGKIDTLANMTKDWSAMVFDIGVAYKENVDRVIEVIKDVGAKLKEDEEYKDKIMEPMEIFGLDKFGDSAVVIKARIKTYPIQQWVVGREFNKRLKVAFDASGIEIPFPHRTIYWGDEISPLHLKLNKEENG
ncbi:MAG: mechanosensitive ion channel protein MscS [Flammeovirgaceae bacterium]|nr:mechanosensitive ion channel protein MscS [Flammeovirgaceae bacterium]MBR09818.1 mechanosensitive ion channel protein MscS [Rickettsiales bacterium]HCX23731.1 mechanosensitive ion channel protein MscS [Cytophagales bacterium]|tara:strand:- start:1688 stop:2608 length:921 start_codon:yes stop_codon:yes gene_type:complete